MVDLEVEELGAGVATGGGGGYSWRCIGGDHSGTGGGGGGSYNSRHQPVKPSRCEMQGMERYLFLPLTLHPLIFPFPIIACRKIYPQISSVSDSFSTTDPDDTQWNGCLYLPLLFPVQEIRIMHFLIWIRMELLPFLGTSDYEQRLPVDSNTTALLHQRIKCQLFRSQLLCRFTPYSTGSNIQACDR